MAVLYIQQSYRHIVSFLLLFFSKINAISIWQIQSGIVCKAIKLNYLMTFSL